MKYLTIRNWREYQHYKDRNPPWIKLHVDLLSSRDWVMWNDASRVLAVACMLLASRTDGKIPHDPAYLQRVAYLNRKPDLKPLIDSGFLVDASNLLADARPETETETETETEKKENSKRKKFVPPTVDEVHDFCERMGYRVDPQHFVDFYAKKGWMVGRNSMKDWQAAVRNARDWDHNKPKKETPRGNDPYTGRPYYDAT